MNLHSVTILFGIAFLPAAVVAQPGNIVAPINPGVLQDAYQLNYFLSPTENGTPGGVPIGPPDGYIDLMNTGQLGAFLTDSLGSICVNIYVFKADQTETACCSCLVPPNALVQLAIADVIPLKRSEALSLGLNIRLVSTIPGLTANSAGTNTLGLFRGRFCNPGLIFTPANLAPGLRAWGTRLQAGPAKDSPPAFLGTTVFQTANLTADELFTMTSQCSGGTCRNCPAVRASQAQ